MLLLKNPLNFDSRGTSNKDVLDLKYSGHRGIKTLIYSGFMEKYNIDLKLYSISSEQGYRIAISRHE